MSSSPVSVRFVRAGGPGGQNVNKVATAVELRYDLKAAVLPGDVKQRLRMLAGSRLTADDQILIVAQEHRTQLQNREAAEARLQAMIAAASVRPKRRRPTKPTRAARENRVQQKKRRSDVKRGRRTRGLDD